MYNLDLPSDLLIYLALVTENDVKWWRHYAHALIGGCPRDAGALANSFDCVFPCCIATIVLHKSLTRHHNRPFRRCRPTAVEGSGVYPLYWSFKRHIQKKQHHVWAGYFIRQGFLGRRYLCCHLQDSRRSHRKSQASPSGKIVFRKLYCVSRLANMILLAAAGCSGAICTGDPIVFTGKSQGRLNNRRDWV